MITPPKVEKVAFKVAFGLLIAAWLLVVLSGCADFTTTKTEAAGKAEAAAGEQWKNTAWAYCNANTTGELLRKDAGPRREFIEYCLKIREE